MFTRVLTVKNNGHTDLRTSQAQLSEKGSQYKEKDYETKILLEPRVLKYPRLLYQVSQREHKRLISHNTASIASILEIRLGLDR